jgi:signal transduction histidine kinase
MTLRRKMTFQIAAMIVGLLLVCAAGLWGVRGLRSDFGIATSGYRELREMYEVASHVASARTLLGVNDRAAAAIEIDRALTKLELAVSREDSGSALRQSVDGPRLSAAFRESIQQAAAQLRLPAGEEAFHAGPASANDAINRAFGEATAVALAIRKTISEHEQAANARWRQTIALVAAVSLAVVLAAIVLGVIQYRGVIRPLRRLGDAVRTMAAGRFDDATRLRGRAQLSGADEFVHLAADFNRMAAELESIYRAQEQKIDQKSQELVRSERLASVGYLAAGVAHEINNPLSVITGYGERAIQQLERGGDSAVAIKHLRIMCEEAYRCKEITDKLLSMARHGDQERKPVSLPKLAREVADLIQALPAHRDRQLRLSVTNECSVLGSAGELKQVLLNLVVNALEAIDPSTGEVTVIVERADGMARLAVSDNGPGMTPDTLGRVFEPFYTNKRGSQSAGTGLGLSISHAIVESHGGRLTAHSDGPGCGSRFVIELPIIDAPSSSE